MTAGTPLLLRLVQPSALVGIGGEFLSDFACLIAAKRLEVEVAVIGVRDPVLNDLYEAGRAFALRNGHNA